MGTVVIGMDPHKRSATIEVMAGDERVLGGGRYGTDAAGYAAMLAYMRRWPQRTWAIEGCQGIGRHIGAAGRRRGAGGGRAAGAVRPDQGLFRWAGPQD
jgi:hypothetical protein